MKRRRANFPGEGEGVTKTLSALRLGVYVSQGAGQGAPGFACLQAAKPSGHLAQDPLSILFSLEEDLGLFSAHRPLSNSERAVLHLQCEG